jgi:hypothetical protein
LAALNPPNAIRPTATLKHKLAFILALPFDFNVLPKGALWSPLGKRRVGSIPSARAAIRPSRVAAGAADLMRWRSDGSKPRWSLSGGSLEFVRPYRVRVRTRAPAGKRVSVPAISLPNSRRLGSPQLPGRHFDGIRPTLRCVSRQAAMCGAFAHRGVRWPRGGPMVPEYWKLRRSTAGGCHG